MKTLIMLVVIIFLYLPDALAAKQRIITLAPHLAEMVDLLEKSDSLIAVSEASNYPEFVTTLPTVANYRGINTTQIVKLQPTHILAWFNGNNPQDIAKLNAMGLNVLSVEINSLDDIAKQIEDIGEFIGSPIAESIAQQFRNDIKKFKARFVDEERIDVFYYSWSKPLQTVGAGAWVTDLIAQCGLSHVFASLPMPYPQVSLSSVLHEQAPLVIAATGEKTTVIERFWATHKEVYQPKIIATDPDKMHRFTPRVLDALEKLCIEARL